MEVTTGGLVRNLENKQPLNFQLFLLLRKLIYMLIFIHRDSLSILFQQSVYPKKNLSSINI